MWLPEGFQAPKSVEVAGSGFHLRQISPDDTELDMVAVMGSQERLWSIFGRAWGWPPATMTAEQDRADLQRHADEMARNESFNYALFDGGETKLVGCVYIDPPERAGADADISWWVIDEHADGLLEESLARFVPMWIDSAWPFARPRYVGVDLTWDAWLSLPETKAEPVASRRLAYHPRHSAHEVLRDLAEATAPDIDQDHYGQGDAVSTLEDRVCDILGKEAAVLMPSGTMAQQIALRLWCDQAHLPRVAFHPTCHLELHEQGAYRQLHGLSATLLGAPERLFTLDDLKGMQEPVAAILFELPQREIGGYLPSWDDLVEMTTWAKEQGIATHLDGARIWETQPFYDRPYADIAALFDSVYVSFYKILGGIAGAALAGPDSLINSARVWMRRHGGNLVHMYPLALSAQLGLDRHLPRMEEYHDKAVEVAEILTSLPGITVRPDPPHTNMMHIFFPSDVESLQAARLRLIDERDIEVFGGFRDTGVPSVSRAEFTVGSGTMDFSAKEIRALLEEFSAHLHTGATASGG